MSEFISNDKKKLALRNIRSELNNRNIANALDTLRSIASPSDDANYQAIYSRLALKIAESLEKNLPVIRIAFLSNSTLDHWVGNLRFWLLLDGFYLDANIIPIGTWRQQILDKTSTFYQFNPDIVWLFIQPNDLEFNSQILFENDITDVLVKKSIDDLNQQLTILREKLSSLVIINNIVPLATRVLGNYEGATTNSLATVIARFNLDLAASVPIGATIFDIAHIASRLGLDKWEDPRLWYHSKHPFSLDVQGEVAFAAARLLGATRGRAKKCIILDLDNTLWGGVIGDDGLDGILVGSNGGSVGEAFASFQTWLKALAERGIALAVCSKNNEALAKEPFIKKQGMVLKLDDFVAFKANWNNKADNIRAIAQELNLGLDAFIFIDDNPAERALVSQELPQVAVPELTNDPADYIRTIAHGHWFETLAISNEDRLRVQAYRQNKARSQAQQTATDLESYLLDLDMYASWGVVDASNIQRVTQLINKTNQFHLTTTRYTEAQLTHMMSSPSFWVGQFSLSDRFGEHGIIAAVILRFDNEKQAFIDTWTMSCRVFSRTMENFIFNILCNITLQNGRSNLIGEYKKSQKNLVVSNLYKNLGGEKNHNDELNISRYIFDLKNRSFNQKTFIRDTIEH